VELDLFLGIVPLEVSLERSESFESLGHLSALELVFFRRRSLKKGMVTFGCVPLDKVWFIRLLLERSARTERALTA